MRISVRAVLLAVLVMTALLMSACSGVQAAPDFGQNFQDQNSAGFVSEASVNAHGSSEAQVVTETPEASGASQADQSSGSNEVVGVVTAMDATTITIDGVAYNLANFSEVQGNIQVGDTVKLEFVTNPDGTLSIRESEAVSETPQTTETTEAGNNEDQQDDNEVVGVVTAMDATTITVDGVVYNLSDFSEVDGSIQVGDTVQLEYIVNADGSLTVSQVEVSSDGTSLNEDSSSNSQGSEDSQGEDSGGDYGGSSSSGSSSGDDD